jgi:DNA polymerase III psi subunit
MGSTENNILHNDVLTALFKNSFLVDLSATQENKEEQTDGPKQLEVMVFHHHAQKELPSSQLALLEAILNACKLNTTQVMIYRKNDTHATPLNALLEKYQPQKIILFGVDPAAIGLPIHFPVFQIQQYQQAQYLHAPSLTDLENYKQLKIQLWQKLKLLFP